MPRGTAASGSNIPTAIGGAGAVAGVDGSRGFGGKFLRCISRFGKRADDPALLLSSPPPTGGGRTGKPSRSKQATHHHMRPRRRRRHPHAASLRSANRLLAPVSATVSSAHKHTPPAAPGSPPRQSLARSLCGTTQSARARAATRTNSSNPVCAGPRRACPALAS